MLTLLHWTCCKYTVTFYTHPFYRPSLNAQLSQANTRGDIFLGPRWCFSAFWARRDESTGVEGVSKVEERQSDEDSRAGEHRWTDPNWSDVSDELVSLVTAGASFVKPSAGWYQAKRAQEEYSHTVSKAPTMWTASGKMLGQMCYYTLDPA